jgi:hypothetical protein
MPAMGLSPGNTTFKMKELLVNCFKFQALDGCVVCCVSVLCHGHN